MVENRYEDREIERYGWLWNQKGDDIGVGLIGGGCDGGGGLGGRS
jgi:hypothetical protein